MKLVIQGVAEVAEFGNFGDVKHMITVVEEFSGAELSLPISEEGLHKLMTFAGQVQQAPRSAPQRPVEPEQDPEEPYTDLDMDMSLDAMEALMNGELGGAVSDGVDPGEF